MWPYRHGFFDSFRASRNIFGIWLDSFLKAAGIFLKAAGTFELSITHYQSGKSKQVAHWSGGIEKGQSCKTKEQEQNFFVDMFLHEKFPCS